MIRTRENNGNILNLFIKQRWPFGCLFFLLIACGNKNQPDTGKMAADFRRIDSTKPLIQSGDLIFRNGVDDISRAARSFNRIDTSFSHCGLLLVENDTVFVYHMLGGQYNPDQKLRRDPIDSFCSPPHIDKFAIYRYDLTPQQSDSLTSIIHYYYYIGLKFDLYFNFLTDDKMYCSEFVFKCLDRALSGALKREIKARQWPFGISPDDLFLNSHSRLVKKVNFAE
jgi:hypothetical protein